MSVVAAERKTCCDECGRPLARVRSSKRFCGATCRSRWNRRRSAAESLDRMALLALEAIRNGADPYLTLSLIVWPPATADEARELLGVAA
jgi:hypothetical protein